MVALADDWRLTEMQALVRLSPAVIVIQYMRLMANTGRAELQQGLTMREMFEAVVAADCEGALESATHDELARRVSG